MSCVSTFKTMPLFMLQSQAGRRAGRCPVCRTLCKHLQQLWCRVRWRSAAMSCPAPLAWVAGTQTPGLAPASSWGAHEQEAGVETSLGLEPTSSSEQPGGRSFVEALTLLHCFPGCDPVAVSLLPVLAAVLPLAGGRCESCFQTSFCAANAQGSPFQQCFSCVS